jgi:hypothetical protein
MHADQQSEVWSSLDRDQLAKVVGPSPSAAAISPLSTGVISFLANAFSNRCKAPGMQHQAALRALAFKWICILYRCWLGRIPYDESHYLLALQKRHASLLKVAAFLES